MLVFRQRWLMTWNRDEVGYIPFDQDAANLFFQLVSSRYEHASLVLTSNLAFSKAHLFVRTCVRWCRHQPSPRATDWPPTGYFRGRTWAPFHGL